MENLGKKLEEAYKLMNTGKVKESSEILEEIYSYFNKEKSKDKSSDANYISCLLGLGVVYMQKKEYKESLKYYNEGYKLTGGKDFNILFNMGVAYTNLGDEKNATKFLDKAKKINPKDLNLLRFIKETSNINSDDFDNNIGDNDIDESFLKKVQSMIDKLK